MRVADLARNRRNHRVISVARSSRSSTISDASKGNAVVWGRIKSRPSASSSSSLAPNTFGSKPSRHAKEYNKAGHRTLAGIHVQYRVTIAVIERYRQSRGSDKTAHDNVPPKNCGLSHCLSFPSSRPALLSLWRQNKTKFDEIKESLKVTLFSCLLLLAPSSVLFSRALMSASSQTRITP